MLRLANAYNTSSDIHTDTHIHTSHTLSHTDTHIHTILIYMKAYNNRSLEDHCGLYGTK